MNRPIVSIKSVAGGMIIKSEEFFATVMVMGRHPREDGHHPVVGVTMSSIVGETNSPDCCRQVSSFELPAEAMLRLGQLIEGESKKLLDEVTACIPAATKDGGS